MDSRGRRLRGPSCARLGVLVAVAIGGALGAPARYAIGRVVHVSTDSFPWATFWTNLSGAFVLGLFVTLVVERFPPSRYPRPFFAVGFLGAYTTFSTMAVETMLLVKHGHAALGVTYIAASIAAGFFLCYLGIVLGRTVPVRTRR